MTLVVKLGSSIVAADDGELRAAVLDSVCEQVAALEQGGERVVMVTSGAIARGIKLRGLEKRPRAMDELQAASAIGQGDVFRAYEERLAAHGTRAAQVLMTASDIHERSHYVNARQTIERLIHWGVVPVINENDTTATDEITFGDNDFLAAQVAVLVKAQLLVLLTNTDGLYDNDPNVSPTARLIREVDENSQLPELPLMRKTSVYGTGGMASKIAAAEMACLSGVTAVICNGTKPGTLSDVVKGEKPIGTRFQRRTRLDSPFKLWLKYAKPSAGTLTVDRGAEERLRESGASLLAVGVMGVEGDFEAGAAVEVVSDWGVIGRGIINFSSRDLLKIVGLRSDAIRELLPGAPDEVIHRDRFVLV